MRTKTLTILPLILGAAWLTGCVTAHPDLAAKQFAEQTAEYYWGQATFLTQNTITLWFTPEEGCGLANDASLKLDTRRQVVAMTFGVNVRPGFNTVQMRKALPDTRWLDSCRLDHIMILGGGVPLLSQGSRFHLVLFPETPAEEALAWQWEIWFALPRYPDGNERSEEEAVAFLKGTHPDKKLRLLEFALCYQLPGCEPGSKIEELHNTKGVGIKIHPASWFPAPR